MGVISVSEDVLRVSTLFADVLEYIFKGQLVVYIIH